MMITHATWEARNMGVDCWEIKIAAGDTKEDFLSKKNEFETDYTVVKIPTDMVDYGLFLQDQGYKYIETMISLHRDSSIPTMNRIQQRILDKMSYSLMNKEDEERLFEEIKKGMFTTDRVYLDPYFTREQASNRYICWIKDEVERGTCLYNIQYKENTVGFFALRDMGNGTFNPPIAGMYQDVKVAGIGIAMDYFEIVETNKCGGKKVLASVSTNNTGAFTIPVLLGYSIDKLEAVYVKHTKGGKG